MNKLEVPNANYEIAICINCDREFIRRLINSSKQLGPGIKGWKAINCSSKCAREWKNLTDTQKRKIRMERNGN